MVKRPTPKLEKLFARVRRLTVERGAKGDLAEAIHVELPRLSEWLRGEYEPGGEVTLSILEWVEEQEAKQQKEEASGALTPKARKTRSVKSTSNEKVQPDQRGGCHGARTHARKTPKRQ
jgi:hypothetical protein